MRTPAQKKAQEKYRHTPKGRAAWKRASDRYLAKKTQRKPTREQLRKEIERAHLEPDLVSVVSKAWLDGSAHYVVQRTHGNKREHELWTTQNTLKETGREKRQKKGPSEPQELRSPKG